MDGIMDGGTDVPMFPELETSIQKVMTVHGWAATLAAACLLLLAMTWDIYGTTATRPIARITLRSPLLRGQEFVRANTHWPSCSFCFGDARRSNLEMEHS